MILLAGRIPTACRMEQWRKTHPLPVSAERPKRKSYTNQWERGSLFTFACTDTHLFHFAIKARHSLKWKWNKCVTCVVKRHVTLHQPSATPRQIAECKCVCARTHRIGRGGRCRSSTLAWCSLCVSMGEKERTTIQKKFCHRRWISSAEQSGVPE